MLLAPALSPSSRAEDEDEDEDEADAPVEMIRVTEVPPEAETELLLTAEVEDEPPPKVVKTPSSLSTERPLEAWEGNREKKKKAKIWIILYYETILFKL